MILKIELTKEESQRVIESGALLSLVKDTKEIPGQLGMKEVFEPKEEKKVETPAETPVETPVETPKQEEPAKTTVPTSEVAYTLDQLQACAGDLVRSGKREELFNALQAMGLKSLLDLKEDQYNDFALKLREIGGNI